MFLFGALFAVGLSFTACSSDNDVAQGSESQKEIGNNKYIAIGINLPTTSSSTRAAATDNAGNVTYDDGLTSEYAVNDATVIIFDGSGNFVEAYDLETKPWNKASSSNNVTEYSTKIVQQVGGSVSTSHQLLVVLNRNNIFSFAELDSDGKVDDLTFDGTTKYSGTFDDFQSTATTLAASAMNTNGFYMANAPLDDKPGSNADPSGAQVRVLVPITNVYETEAAAQAGVADQIYVERGLAKVTVEPSAGSFTTSTLSGGTKTTINYGVTSWALDNLNPQTYLVRSTANHSTFLGLISQESSLTSGKAYRYVGNTQITYPSAQTYGYRTYFAESANYDKSTALTRNNTFASTDNPQYCLENTFAVANQVISKTTLVQLAVTAKIDKNNTGTFAAANLYTLGGNKQVIYDLDLLKAYIQDKAYTYIDNNGYRSGTFASGDITVTLGAAGADKIIPSITLTTTNTTGVTASSGTVSSGTLTFNSTITDAVFSSLGAIVEYTGGVSYYNVRIKHFGDGLTPWKTWEEGQSLTPPAAGGIDAIYPKNSNATAQANDYLGRYGVLRNNWYNIAVSSIRSLGDAVPHTGDWPDDPDDEIDAYISFQINILSWAKHVTQSADL